MRSTAAGPTPPTPSLHVAGVVRAQASKILLAAAADLVLFSICATATTMTFMALGSIAGSVALVATIMLLGLHIHMIITRGQTVGWMLVGIRLVTENDGAPLGYRGLLPLQAVWMADVRLGREPVALSIAPPALAPHRHTSSPPIPWTPAVLLPPMPLSPHELAAATVLSGDRPAASDDDDDNDDRDETVLRPSAGSERRLLVVNGASTHPLSGRTLVGRSPAGDDAHAIIAVADLSRLMSKTHLMLENTPEGRLFVTDLGSTNGTLLERAQGQAPLRLAPQVRTELDLSSTLRVGQNVLAFMSPATAKGGA